VSDQPSDMHDIPVMSLQEPCRVQESASHWSRRHVCNVVDACAARLHVNSEVDIVGVLLVLRICLQLLSDAAPSVPNVSRLRLVNAGARGSDAAALANALLQFSSLRVLQLHQVRSDTSAVHGHMPAPCWSN
jgi:hypothetical protein